MHVIGWAKRVNGSHTETKKKSVGIKTQPVLAV